MITLYVKNQGIYDLTNATVIIEDNHLLINNNNVEFTTDITETRSREIYDKDPQNFRLNIDKAEESNKKELVDDLHNLLEILWKWETNSIGIPAAGKCYMFTNFLIYIK
jgi:hypothetical protein